MRFGCIGDNGFVKYVLTKVANAIKEIQSIDTCIHIAIEK